MPPIPAASSHVQLQPGVADDKELAGDQNTHQGEYLWPLNPAMGHEQALVPFSTLGLSWYVGLSVVLVLR